MKNLKKCIYKQYKEFPRDYKLVTSALEYNIIWD